MNNKKTLTIKDFASLFGEENARIASEAWGGGVMYFPKKRHALLFENQADKEAYILQMFYKGGFPPEEIAAAMGLTVKYIRGIVWGKKQND